jgi:uncharacterized iron-regulated membrane protein
MEQSEKKKPFNKRAFISIALFVSGISLPFSGLMNHKLQVDQLTVERHFWMSVHNSAAILFAILAFLHVSYNWPVLTNYIKKAKGIFIRKEALTAIALVIVILGLITLNVFHGR